MRTISRHWPQTAPRGDYQAMCDYCGVQWRRSELRRDAAGKLACPDDQPGRDEVTLSRLNAESVTQRELGRYPRDGSNLDTDTPGIAPPSPVPTPITTNSHGAS